MRFSSLSAALDRLTLSPAVPVVAAAVLALGLAWLAVDLGEELRRERGAPHPLTAARLVVGTLSAACSGLIVGLLLSLAGR